MTKLAIVVSFVFIGNITTIVIPSNAQVASERSTNNNAELKQLLDEGRRLLDMGDYNGAIDNYQRALTIQPRNASIHSGIGILYVKQGNLPAARTAFQRAVQLAPNNADYQYALGYINANLGDYAKAKEAYRRTVQLNRRHFKGYMGLATVLTRLGENTNAMWAYQEAVKIDPNNPLVSDFRNQLKIEQKKK
jgi:Flp pilus assembly protein TadD